MKELDDLHLPSDWRRLFHMSGVPDHALNDLQSTRSLINIVNETINLTEVPQNTSEAQNEEEDVEQPGTDTADDHVVEGCTDDVNDNAQVGKIST